MEVTDDDSVEPKDPHEWSSEKVVTVVRSLGTDECFQSAGDQVIPSLTPIHTPLYIVVQGP